MSKSFVNNLFLLTGLNLLIKPFYLLVIEAEIQNELGLQDFGLYFALINFSYVLNIVLDLGITNWNTRQVAINGKIDTKIMASILSLRLLLSAVYLLLSVGIAAVLNYSSDAILLLVLLCFNQILSSTTLFLRSCLTGLHLFKWDSIVSIMDRGILILLLSWLLWGRPESIRLEWFIWSQTFAYTLTLLFAAWRVLAATGKIHIRPDSSAIKKILAESLPYAALILVSMICYRIDSVMLERMHSATESGIYAMSFRFFEAINMVAYLFAVLLLPMFTRILAKKEDVSDLFSLSLRIMFSGVLIPFVLALFAGQKILNIIYHNPVSECNSVFQWLMLSAVFFSLQYVSGTLITASGRMKPMTIIALAGMIINIALNLILIPDKGALGAAQASFIAQFLVFVIQMLHIRRDFHVSGTIHLSLRIALFSASSLLCAYLLSSIISEELYTIILIPLSMLAMAFLTGMLRSETIKNLLKSRQENVNL